MKRIAVTMRVDIVAGYDERRDALDQRWHTLLAACELIAFPVPNNIASALAILDSVDGVLLSGGNDLVCLGGNVTERDATEGVLVDAAVARSMPVFGVCRGMQFLASRYGCTLGPVESHIGRRHSVLKADGTQSEVNSYHRFGISELGSGMQPLAIAADGSIEALRHVTLPVSGMMWHPEREDVAQPEDVALIRRSFGLDI